MSQNQAAPDSLLHCCKVIVTQQPVTDRRAAREGVETFCKQLEGIIPRLIAALPDVLQLVELTQATTAAFQVIHVFLVCRLNMVSVLQMGVGAAVWH